VAHVGAVQFQKIESVKESAVLFLAAAQLLKHRKATFEDRPDSEMVHGLNEERIPGSPVMAVARQQPDARGIAPAISL
jgi:hypothetical protein